MTQTLFRQEAIEAQAAGYLGTIRLGRNPRHAAVAFVALLLAAALVGFASLAEVTRKANLPGLLVPSMGMLSVQAPALGHVSERRVAEGQLVAVGDVLFVVAVDRPGERGGTAERVSSSLRQRREALQSERALRSLAAQQRSDFLQQRLRALAAESAQAETEARLADQRVSLAQDRVARHAELAAGGFVSPVQVQQQQEALIDLQSRAVATHRAVQSLLRDLDTVRAEQAAARTQADTDQTLLDRQLAQLQQEDDENEARRNVLVTAPVAGRVTALHVWQGAAVTPGQALATIVPDAPDDRGVRPVGKGTDGVGHVEGGTRARAPADSVRSGEPPLHAELYGPSRTIGFVRPGQTVWLRHAAFPYQKYGMTRGTVVSVSDTPIAPGELPAGHQWILANELRTSESKYRIMVRIDAMPESIVSTARQLKPGMTVDADVVQDRLSIMNWITQQLSISRFPA